ncbi:hypothetical protein [Terribacillus aidingensis]|nr:hypothetical protein [Terribacillus aidingensis]
MTWGVPVPGYQYMDYQNRGIGTRKSRYTIESVNPVIPDQTRDTFEQRVQGRLDYQATMPNFNKDHPTEKTPFDRKSFSLLTGKGRHFDTYC